MIMRVYKRKANKECSLCKKSFSRSKKNFLKHRENYEANLSEFFLAESFVDIPKEEAKNMQYVFSRKKKLAVINQDNGV